MKQHVKFATDMEEKQNFINQSNVYTANKLNIVTIYYFKKTVIKKDTKYDNSLFLERIYKKGKSLMDNSISIFFFLITPLNVLCHRAFLFNSDLVLV